MLELSKKTRKELRKLLQKAYAKELDRYLLDLSNKFDEWKSQKIDCWALVDDIHTFHDEVARKLFNFYNASGVDQVYMISRAFAMGLLEREEIPSEAIGIVEKCAKEFFTK